MRGQVNSSYQARRRGPSAFHGKRVLRFRRSLLTRPDFNVLTALDQHCHAGIVTTYHRGGWVKGMRDIGIPSRALDQGECG